MKSNSTNQNTDPELHVAECPHCEEEFFIEGGTGEYKCPHCGGEVECTLECPECGTELEVESWDECACPECETEFDPWECSEIVEGEEGHSEFSIEDLAERGETAMEISAKDIPIIDVDLDAPADERWEAPCRKISGMVGELTDEVIELAEEGLHPNLQFLLQNRGKIAAKLLSLPVGMRLGSLYQESWEWRGQREFLPNSSH